MVGSYGEMQSTSSRCGLFASWLGGHALCGCLGLAFEGCTVSDSLAQGHR